MVVIHLLKYQIMRCLFHAFICLFFVNISFGQTQPQADGWFLKEEQNITKVFQYFSSPTTTISTTPALIPRVEIREHKHHHLFSWKYGYKKYNRLVDSINNISKEINKTSAELNAKIAPEKKDKVVTTINHNIADTNPKSVVTHYISKHFKIWNNSYYFYDGGTIDINGKQYEKIYIPYHFEGVTEATVEWIDDASLVDTNDYNTWLLLEKGDFERLKKDRFGHQKKQFVFSALTIPLKIHPGIPGHQNSLFNSNFNVGTFIGVRLPHRNKGGISLGGFAGYSTMDQNSSNNNSIKDDKSINIAAANYGGGFVVDIGKNTQIGCLLGFDHTFGDICNDYIYQNNCWFALSLNFQFLNLGSNDDSQKQKSD